MSKAGCVGLVTVVGLVAAFSSTSLSAQTIHTPKFYVWGEYPEDTYGTFVPSLGPSSDKVKKIIRKSLTTGYYPPSGPYAFYYDHPDVLAAHIADWIEAEQALAVPRLDVSDSSNTDIVVLLENFGVDSAACDRAFGIAEPVLGGTRFFLEEDRLPGINEWAAINAPPQYPERRTTASNVRSARAYRHPFIRNGKTDPPLGAWMEEFVDALEYEYITRGTIPDPATYRYYFDIEPFLVSEGDANGVWILDYLADPTQYGDTTHTYWNNPSFLVPGTGGKTLQDCYNDYRSAHSLSAYWPANNPASDLNPGVEYFREANGPFITWYAELCHEVENFVIDNCFYSVLRAKWGNSVKCGNYANFTTDGAVDTFGWNQDRPWDTDIDTSNTNNNSLSLWDTTDSLKRIAIQKNKGGARQYLYPPAASLHQTRLFDFVTNASGTTDSPVAYPIVDGELDGFGFLGHRRTNFYSAYHDPESAMQATTRYNRQIAESILNSVTPNTFNATCELSPWMWMPNASGDSDAGRPGFIERKYARNLLAMFRGKNIKEGLFFTDFFIRQTEPDRTDSITQLSYAWDQTQRTVTEVYSTRVKSYTRTWSKSTIPAVVYEDAGESTAAKAARLEFTLRESPQTAFSEREVRLDSRLVPVLPPATPTTHQTVLTVDFDWVDTTYAGEPDPTSGDYVNSRTKAEINLECSIEFLGEHSSHTPTSDDFGIIEYWSDASGSYEPVESYTFNAPVSSDNRWRMRLQAVLSPTANMLYVFPDSAASNAPRTRLRLTHRSPYAFKSRYDLVQFVPTDEIYAVPLSLMSVANSDMNRDGVVDPLDLNIYFDEWASDRPAADFDADSAVTTEDADAFIDAYLAGT